MTEYLVVFVYALVVLGFYGAQPEAEKDWIAAVVWPYAVGELVYDAYYEYNATGNQPVTRSY